MKFSNESTDLKGIFYYLKKTNDDYGSRYSIKGNTTDESPECLASDLDKYNDENSSYCFRSIKGEASFRIEFDSLFYTTGYGIVNRFRTIEGNSFPKSWILYGIDSFGELHKIDEQVNQTFCGPNDLMCTEETIKKYQVTTPRWIGYKTIYFNQTESSNGVIYLFLRAFDLYGFLCGEEKTCAVKIMTCSKEYSMKSVFSILMLLYSNGVSIK